MIPVFHCIYLILFYVILLLFFFFALLESHQQTCVFLFSKTFFSSRAGFNTGGIWLVPNPFQGIPKPIEISTALDGYFYHQAVWFDVNRDGKVRLKEEERGGKEGEVGRGREGMRGRERQGETERMRERE